MNSEELKAKQQEAIDQYKRALESEPEVKKWVDHKKKLRLFAILYLLAYYVVEFMAYNSVNADINMTRLVVKFLFGVFWMSLFLLPTAAWKVSDIFYISAIWNFFSLAKLYGNQKDFSIYFQHGALYSIFFIMSVAIPVLQLVLACWLTIPKKHRELADRAQEINQVYMDNVKQINK